MLAAEAANRLARCRSSATLDGKGCAVQGTLCLFVNMSWCGALNTTNARASMRGTGDARGRRTLMSTEENARRARLGWCVGGAFGADRKFAEFDLRRKMISISGRFFLPSHLQLISSTAKNLAEIEITFRRSWYLQVNNAGAEACARCFFCWWRPRWGPMKMVSAWPSRGAASEASSVPDSNTFSAAL